MRDEPCWHPDLLRRFVPTPYVFSKGDGLNRLFIESNDLEIALSVRHSDRIHRQSTLAGGLFCKLIRDMACPVYDSEMTIISDGALRVLYLGQGTTLIHDRERSELLGFIARDVQVQKLVSSLIPALLDESVNNKSFQSLLQRSDKQHIAL
jgi:hypothetical protein